MGMMDTMRTMDTYCVQLAAALDGAASRVLRYGDEDEEATSGDRSSTSGDRSSTSALPTLRFDALLGELVQP